MSREKFSRLCSNNEHNDERFLEERKMSPNDQLAIIVREFLKEKQAILASYAPGLSDAQRDRLCEATSLTQDDMEKTLGGLVKDASVKTILFDAFLVLNESLQFIQDEVRTLPATAAEPGGWNLVNLVNAVATTAQASLSDTREVCARKVATITDDNDKTLLWASYEGLALGFTTLDKIALAVRGKRAMPDRPVENYGARKGSPELI
jgi:hypothetical protein